MGIRARRRFCTGSAGGIWNTQDPFLIRSPWKRDGEANYYLLATDLRIASGKGWQAAQYQGSRDIIVWESPDLVHWSKPAARQVAIPGAGCAWAPEAIYDEEKDAILVFWASMCRLPGDAEAKQRIYAAYTRDFKNFSERFLYLESSNHVIDTTIIRGKEGYYRYSKDETEKNIRVDFGTSLRPEAFHGIPSETLQNLYGVEGPEIFRFNDREEWCLILDRFASGKGYIPLITDNLAGGNFRIPEEDQFSMGLTRKRHGGILNLTEAEYRRLQESLSRSEER